MVGEWVPKGAEGLGGNTWRVVFDKGAGALHEVHMPMEVLAWRAAEYGIPEDDPDALMEVVFHEIQLTLAWVTPEGPTLFEAESTTQAREAHLARLDRSPVKVKVKGVAALDPIRQSHRPDPVRARAMREHIDTTRWLNRYGALPVAAPSRHPRIPTSAKESR